MNGILLIALFVSVGANVMGGVILLVFNNASAQVEPNTRYFQKDFCENERNTLDGITYTNGEEISYGESGCPISQITISDWSEISTANKLVITNRLGVNGYNDVTSAVLSQ